MQRRLNEVITALPEARRRRVEARAQALMSQVE
ncbi:MAG: XRE family transcriptional regulator, partial [Phenylobacterium sp.]|nr:XRE family transcriptional regulator [Phenylobacterium sp.]